MSSDVYRNLKSELDKGKKAAVVTFINHGDSRSGSSHHKLILTEERLHTSDTLRCLDETTVNRAKFALETGNVQYFQLNFLSGCLKESACRMIRLEMNCHPA